MALIDHLLDTSVINRARAEPVRQRVEGLVGAGSVALCEIVVAEVLRGTRSREHHSETLDNLRGFHWVPTPGDVWDRVLQVQSALAVRGLQQSVKVPDLLVAAAAERAGVGVLHYDHDFDTIAEITGQRCEWVVSRGSAP